MIAREVHVEESMVVRMLDVVKIVRRDNLVEATVFIPDVWAVPVFVDVVVVFPVECIFESFMPWDVYTTHIV